VCVCVCVCVRTEQQAAVGYCPSCELDLCDDCTTSLHSNKGLAKHHVVELSKKASVIGPPLCQVHKGRPKDLYCLDCKVCEVDGYIADGRQVIVDLVMRDSDVCDS